MMTDGEMIDTLNRVAALVARIPAPPERVEVTPQVLLTLRNMAVTDRRPWFEMIGTDFLGIPVKVDPTLGPPGWKIVRREDSHDE